MNNMLDYVWNGILVGLGLLAIVIILSLAFTIIYAVIKETKKGSKSSDKRLTNIETRLIKIEADYVTQNELKVPIESNKRFLSGIKVVEEEEK